MGDAGSAPGSRSFGAARLESEAYTPGMTVARHSAAGLALLLAACAARSNRSSPDDDPAATRTVSAPVSEGAMQESEDMY